MVYKKQFLHELRSTPGFTNYVLGVNKNLNGQITSAELKRYYSNIDAEIYINGKWVEDIATIQWHWQQQTVPLFGYNSYVWDDVAQGVRYIQGSFSVNFTKPNYINSVTKDNGTTLNETTGTTVVSYEGVQESEVLQSYTVTKHENTTIKNEVHEPIFYRDKKNKFDIHVVCGNQDGMNENPVHIILKDCVVTGASHARGADSGVAQEQYSFIAKDYLVIE